jgi:DNA-binding CsgD family transcriptional regulator
MTVDHRIVRTLRGVAARLTPEFDLQKDLMQEMFIHLVRVEADRPGRTLSWYLQSCQLYAGNYLARGRSVDSIKRGHNLVPVGQSDEDGISPGIDPADPIDLRSELIVRDIVDQLVPQLTGVQQQILFLLMHGFGVREVARQLRVSHPTIIKHRKRIARIASALLADAGSNGSNGNPPVRLNRAGYHVEENGKEVGNAARQHEDMPNRMVISQPVPSVETDSCGVSQTACQQ